MYWKLEWQRIPAESISNALAAINSRLPIGPDGGPFQDTGDPNSNELNTGSVPFSSNPSGKLGSHQSPLLPVRGIRRRRLSFYGERRAPSPDTVYPRTSTSWWVYELECDVSRRDLQEELVGYRQAFAFVVCGLGRNGQSDPAAIERAVLLDWTSTPIHNLNAELELSLDGEGTARDYLMFFCSFLGSDEGDTSAATQPFLLPPSTNALDWASRTEDIPSPTKMPVDNEKPDDWDFTAAGTNGVHSVGAFQQATPPARQVAAREDARRDARKDIDSAFAQLGAPNPVRVRTDVTTTDEQGREGFTFRGLVWYRGKAFLSDFLVERQGLVTMLGDDPVAAGQDLGVPRYEVRISWFGLSLLCLQRQRRLMDSEQFKTEFRAHNIVRGARVNARNVILTDTYTNRARIEDVEFLGNLILDECIFERSLEIRDCRVLGHVSALNMTVKGSCVFAGTRIDGTTADTKSAPAALRLHGMRAERGFFGDRLSVEGRITGHGMKVKGDWRAHGLQVRSLGRADRYRAIDLEGSEIEGALDLTCRVPEPHRPGGNMRTYLGGNGLFEGIRAREFRLRGARVEGFLDLSHGRIDSQVDLSPVALPGPRSASVVHDAAWRTYIGGDLNLARASIGLLFLPCVQVTGSLNLVEVDVKKSVFASLLDQFRFRSRFGENVVLSGATVAGDVEFGGALIGAALEIVTGRIGRLRAPSGLGYVPGDHQEITPMVLPTQIGKIALVSLAVTTDISLVGANLTGGGIITRTLSLGGSLHLWRVNVIDDLVQTVKQAAQAMNATVTPESRWRGQLESLRTHIGDDMALRGVQTGGDVHLGNASINGQVDLANARIGGNLSAYITESRFGSALTECSKKFDISVAKIDGDVDLRGLRVATGDLSGRAAEILGACLLSGAEVDSGKSDLVVVSKGQIDLTQAAASRCAINAESVSEGQKITLARARFGQLTLSGFGEKKFLRPWKFPRPIDLTRVEVGDWDIDEPRKVLPLLRATDPFDRNVFVGLEERLARLGHAGIGRSVYRMMKWRGLRERQSSNVLLWCAWCVNGIFSRHGTVWWLPFLWLLMTILVMWAVLVEPGNVVERNKPQSPQQWTAVRALVLATGWAIPFYGGWNRDEVAPSDKGTCLPNWLGGLLDLRDPPADRPGQVTNRSVAAACERRFESVSPRELAQGMSLFQFFLWILLAANLPTFIRRPR